MENQITLVPRQESYKLVISKELEEMIRLMCNKLPDNEWSGTLFYTVEGSFEDKNLRLVAKNFYLQDIGSGSFTEFQNDATLAGYMVDNDLLDCEQGLIHSHNKMATIFEKGKLGSGTDMSTLKEEGSERNHFLSLIVNNAGNYAAAITRKVTRKATGTASLVYNTFNNIPVLQGGKEFETESTIIEYFMLEIDKEETNIVKTPLELRIEELKESKKLYINANKFGTWNTNSPFVMPKEDEIFHRPKNKPVQYDLFTKAPYVEEVVPKTDEDVINSCVDQLITGNIMANQVNRYAWTNNMEDRFKERFKTQEAFQLWADSFIEVLIEDIDIEKGDPDIIISQWSQDLIDALTETGIHNEYVDYYINTLTRWIV